MSASERLLAIAVTAGALWLVYLLQPILSPFLLGIVIAYLGDPLADWLERRGVPRSVGASLVFVVFALLFAGALLVLIPLLLREVTQFVRDIPAFILWLQQTTSPLLLEYFGVDPFDIRIESLREKLSANWQRAGSMAGRLLAEATASGMALLSTFMNIALTPVVAFYLLRDWDIALLRIQEMIPRSQVQALSALARECDEVIGAFLRGQLMVMLLLGVSYSAGLLVIGLDLAILIGMVAGLANIVPYLGFVVGIAAALVASVFQFQDLLHPLLVVGVFVLGQMLEGTVLTPLLVGDRIGLHPVAVIFAVLAGGQLFGFIGVLLALPMAAVIMVFVRRLHDNYLESEFYSEESE